MWTAKRFYKEVTTGDAAGGFSVLLDGRPVKTPSGTKLEVPTRDLAEAIAGEWSAQDDEIRADSMSNHQLAATAIDRVRVDRIAIVDGIVAYAQTDLLCYRAEAPADLARRQNAVWQPLLGWMRNTHGVAFLVTAGVMPVAQAAEVEVRLRQILDGYDEFALAAISSATTACGSVVVALALAARKIGPDEAFEAALLDESFQAERWGMDEEAVTRRKKLRCDVQAVWCFLELVRKRATSTTPTNGGRIAGRMGINA